MNEYDRAYLLGWAVLYLVGACSPSRPDVDGPKPTASARSTTPVGTTQPSTAESAPTLAATLETPRGMAFIPGGALVAGSTPGSLPRRPDRELPGEQVMLKGFWIDKFAYPNEEGAIPLTSVAQAEAQSLCEKAGKRLCTELEWERACKGPDNLRYAWGNDYRADACELGAVILPRPSGMKIGCHSEFGVYDLHGGVLEWTQSIWKRGGSSGLVVLKGGNSIDGQLTGRCANAEPSAPSNRSNEVGFRCCKGPVNRTDVVIQARTHEAVEPLDRLDKAQFERLLASLPPEARPAATEGKWTLDRAYAWHPVNNETLNLFVACQMDVKVRRCGLLVGRDSLGRPMGLGFADTGVITSSLHMDSRAEDIWLIGLDATGSFKRLVRYRAGGVTFGTKERRLPTPKKHGSKNRKSQAG